MASAFLASGLNWQQSLGAVALGFVLIAIPITLQGTMGARLNIPFPILVRGSFGMYLSYFCIVSRSILAMFWFGISTATGGTLTGLISFCSKLTQCNVFERSGRNSPIFRINFLPALISPLKE